MVCRSASGSVGSRRHTACLAASEIDPGGTLVRAITFIVRGANPRGATCGA